MQKIKTVAFAKQQHNINLGPVVQRWINPQLKFNPLYRQFQLLVYACRGRWEVRYHIADYAEKIKMATV
jgi:hypothetical protein